MFRTWLNLILWLCLFVNSSEPPPSWEVNERFGFDGVFDPELIREIEKFEKDSRQFYHKYYHNDDMNNLKNINEMLIEFEQLTTRRMMLSSYPHLILTTNRDKSNIQQKVNSITTRLTTINANYFTFVDPLLGDLKINHNDNQSDPKDRQSDPKDRESDPKAPQSDSKETSDDDDKKYLPYIHMAQKFARHRLDPEVEMALEIRDQWYGPTIISDLFISENTAMNVTFQNPRTNETMTLDRSQAQRYATTHSDSLIRRQVFKKFDETQGRILGPLAAATLNIVAGQTVIDTKARKFDGNYRGSQCLENQISPETVSNMLKVCRTKGVKFAKRYNKLRKRVLSNISGLDEYTWAERIAPILVGKDQENLKFSWDEAVQIVEDVYREFSPTMADLFKTQLEEKRYDGRVGPFKATLDYCMSVSPELGSFVTVGFNGSLDDISTLAHETGHVITFDLAAKEHGILQSYAPRVMSEVAPLYAEEMTFMHIIKKEKDETKLLNLIMGELDNAFNTVVRQAAFDLFEWRVCEERENGPLSVNQFSQIWIDSLREFYGDSFDDYENIGNGWISVHHFFESPFYVHSYVFAQLVAAALAKVYAEKPLGFEHKFLNLLKAGMTKNFTELMTPFGLDGDSVQFWDDAIEYQFETLLSRAEKLVERLLL